MDPNKTTATDRRTAQFCIWTLRNQILIAHHIRIFTWGGTILILFLALAGRISLEAALHAVVISLPMIVFLLWMLIMARRKSLLNIRDPELREQAHLAMLQNVYKRRLTDREKTWLLKKFGRRYCELGHC